MMQVIFRILVIAVLTITIFGCQNENAKQRKMEDSAPAELTRDTTHTISYLMGQFIPSEHALFVEIDSQYADRKGLYLRKEAYADFKKMWTAAAVDDVQLQIRSAARNFDYQKGIWERKWNGETILSDGTDGSEIDDPKERALKILLYSSMPGTSRHHWGTDIDLNSFSNKWFESGEGLEVYHWLQNNAHLYGFCQVYTEKGSERPYGYEEEKWHWTYMPISKPLTLYAQSSLQNDMIKGFNGAEVANEIDVVSKYVLGIHPNCLR